MVVVTTLATASWTVTASAQTEESGSSSITFGTGDDAGVVARAFSYSRRNKSQSPPQPDFRNRDNSDSLYPEAIVVTSIPELLDVTPPAPCVQRKFGDNTCFPEPKEKTKKPRPPSPEELARIATDRAITLAPQPELRVAPRAIGLTGLPSYFWLAAEPQPISATAGALGLVVNRRGSARSIRVGLRRWIRERYESPWPALD